MPSPRVGLHGPLGRAMDRVDTGMNWLSRAAMMVMLVLILIQVFTRYILNDPIEGVIGATELYLMPIIVFGSLSYLEMYDGHVRVGIVFDALPEGLRAGFNVVLRLAAAAFFALICYGASREALKAWDFGYRTSGDIDAPYIRRTCSPTMVDCARSSCPARYEPATKQTVQLHRYPAAMRWA